MDANGTERGVRALVSVSHAHVMSLNVKSLTSIGAFTRQTFSGRRHLGGRARFSRIPLRPEPSRCPSGCPERRHSLSPCERNEMELLVVIIRRKDSAK